MKTLNHARSAFFHNKNRSASWVFLIVLSNFFFLQKHNKKRSICPQYNIASKTILEESCDHTIQTTGVGDE